LKKESHDGLPLGHEVGHCFNGLIIGNLIIHDAKERF
jgi:hypothetical protein